MGVDEVTGRHEGGARLKVLGPREAGLGVLVSERTGNEGVILTAALGRWRVAEQADQFVPLDTAA